MAPATALPFGFLCHPIEYNGNILSLLFGLESELPFLGDFDGHFVLVSRSSSIMDSFSRWILGAPGTLSIQHRRSVKLFKRASDGFIDVETDADVDHAIALDMDFPDACETCASACVLHGVSSFLKSDWLALLETVRAIVAFIEKAIVLVTAFFSLRSWCTDAQSWRRLRPSSRDESTVVVEANALAHEAGCASVLAR